MNTKAASERYQRQLGEVAKLPGNDVCADCRGRMPRWASWSLGIFICVNCATVHRKMGTHLSKVKSLTLDTWTKEQVERMREVGNVKSNAKFNPDERRHRPPVNIDDAERSSELERYIFDKYRGRFMADAAPKRVEIPYGQNAPPLPSKGPRDGRGAMHALTNGQEEQRRQRATTLSTLNAASPSIAPRVPARPIPSISGTSISSSAAERQSSPTASRSSLAPPQASVPPRSSSANVPSSGSASSSSALAMAGTTASSSVFDDLMSLSTSATAPQMHNGGMHLHLPVPNPAQQMNPWAHLAMQQQAVVSPMVMAHASSAASSPFQQPMMTGQQSYLQPMATGWSGSFGYAGQTAAPLSATTTGIGNASQPVPFAPAMQGTSFFGSNGGASLTPTSAQALGQSAFLSPYGQGQQPSHDDLRATSAPTGHNYTYGVAPNGTSSIATGNSNPFGQFASSMMPGGGATTHAQEAQTFARGWPGTKQNNPWA